MSWDVARARKVLRSLFDTAVAPCRPLAAPCLSLRRLKRSSMRSRLSRALFPRAARGVPRRVKPLRADRRCHPCGGLHAGEEILRLPSIRRRARSPSRTAMSSRGRTAGARNTSISLLIKDETSTKSKTRRQRKAFGFQSNL